MLAGCQVGAGQSRGCWNHRRAWRPASFGFNTPLVSTVPFAFVYAIRTALSRTPDAYFVNDDLEACKAPTRFPWKLRSAPSLSDRRAPLTAAVLTAFALAGIYYLGYLELVTSQYGRPLGKERLESPFSRGRAARIRVPRDGRPSTGALSENPPRSRLLPTSPSTECERYSSAWYFDITEGPSSMLSRAMTPRAALEPLRSASLVTEEFDPRAGRMATPSRLELTNRSSFSTRLQRVGRYACIPRDFLEMPRLKKPRPSRTIVAGSGTPETEIE